MFHILPAQDFFKPTDNFSKWLDESIHVRYNHIIDMGAGRGLLTRYLQDKGYKASGFDVNMRENPVASIQVCRPEIARRVLEQLDDNPVLMIARPCHDGFAADYFRLWLHEYHYLFAYYIGLERNVENDLHGLSYKLVAKSVGEDGENVYQIFGMGSAVQDFYYLNGWAGIYCIKDGEYVSDFPRIRKDLNEVVRKKVESVLTVSQQAPSLDRIIDTQADCGWIAPDGKVYKIPYTQHSEFMYDYVLLDTHGQAASMWMKVWPPGTGSGLSAEDDHYRWCMNNFDAEPSKAQVKALKREFGITYRRPRIKELKTPSRKDY